MRLTIDLDREIDGRWIGAVRELSGCLVCGRDRAEAVERVRGLARRIVADQVDHGERDDDVIEFVGP